jgi:plastocyanin
MPLLQATVMRRARCAVVAFGVLVPGVARAQITGRVVITEARGRLASDLGNAVVYLEGRSLRGASPATVEMATDGRQFRPRILVIPVGATVRFTNLDPFNHNVFSLSEPNAFDLGLYGRGEVRIRRFTRPGLVRVYCNIHSQMSAFVVVRDNPWYAQPGVDGSYAIDDVPPGRYVLHVWHERAPAEVVREIVVSAGGLAGLADTLNASGYRWTDHVNKYGHPYDASAARERY